MSVNTAVDMNVDGTPMRFDLDANPYPTMDYPNVDRATAMAMASKVLWDDATIFSMEPSWLNFTWNERREYSSDPCRWYT